MEEKPSKELSKILTKEFLEKRLPYFTLAEIGKEVGCHGETVRLYARKQGITTRNSGAIILPKKEIIEEYLNKKIPLYKIAQKFNCDGNIIRRNLISWGIKIRSKKEAQQNKPGHSEEVKKKISLNNRGKHSGEKCSFWEGGKSSLRSLIRASLKNIEWKKEVYRRDNYTCQDCGVKSGGGKTVYFEAHHIKEFRDIFKEFLQCYPHLDKIKNKEELLKLALDYLPFWDIYNGKTLCKKCHDKTYKLKGI